MNRNRPSLSRMTMALVVCGVVAAYGGDGAKSAAAPTAMDSQRATSGARNFGLKWYTIDCGGGKSVGGGFAVLGTIGQPDAGTLSGGGFELRGGYQQSFGCGDCPTDVDGNGSTDAFDLANLLGAWGSCNPGEPCECLDADANGSIDAFDLATLLGDWGPCL